MTPDDVEASMANNQMVQQGSVSVTCPSCDYTVAQASGSRRTICPNCGNFYDRESAERARLVATRRTMPNNLLRPGDDKSDKDRNGGRLQSIANFFHNLTPNRKPKSDLDSRSINSRSSSVRNDRNGPSRTELPPIDSGAKTQGQALKPRLSPQPPNRSSGSSPKQAKVIYPLRTKSIDRLHADMEVAKETGQWKDILDFYATTFDSFLEINAAFKRDPSKEYQLDDCGLKFNSITIVYDNLLNVPQDVQKAVLKTIINCLLKDKRNNDSRHVWPHTKDDLRAYLILLLNPQFNNISTYVIFAHLLRQVAALSDHDHHFMVHWLKKLHKDLFKELVQKIHNFVSGRLFPAKPQDLPAMSKCTWWIPSGTKVLALLNAANNLTNSSIIQYTDFYNCTLDHLDLMAEYYSWQNPSSHSGFSFCQYPFILSIAGKRAILQRDSEQQMIITARRSLVAKVQRRQLPDIGMLFLNLTVRRSHLVTDSLREIAQKKHDLKKKLKVTFAGEPGLDMGGLTKEWFLLLLRQIFKPEYGMFTYDKPSGNYWFSTASCESYQEFNLVGVLMGLAVYNSIILDIHFPQYCYTKLLSPAVVPYNNPRASVGIAPTLTLDDLKQGQPDLARGLQDLLDYDGNVEDDFGMTFQISSDDVGSVQTHSLKPNGEDISVTKDNRKEYVQLYSEWVINKSIYNQFQAFYHGFHSVCASNALIMMRPEEVETLVCGCPTLDMSELKKVTVYDGYTAEDSIIKNFWDITLAMKSELQKSLLLFCTGSDRVPVGGMGEMQFKISRVDASDLLPMSHTCFNQLVLPAYRTKKLLKQKLTAAIQNAEGFGLE